MNCTLMDYIRRTVTFGLRSIIRSYAIKSSETPALWRITCIYVSRRHDATGRTVLCPRISIKTSNFIFKFAQHRHRSHRSCSLSLLNSSSFWGSASFRHHPFAFPFTLRTCQYRLFTACHRVSQDILLLLQRRYVRNNKNFYQLKLFLRPTRCTNTFDRTRKNLT